MRLSSIVLLPVIFCSFLNCFSSGPQIKDEALFTQGFIGENRFQVIITAKPDQSARGLVAQRDSAVTRARNDLQKKTLDALVQYRIEKYQNDISASGNFASVMSPLAAQKLNEGYLSLLSSGEIAEEYYEKDNTAVIIFRIEKDGLKKTVDSVSVDESKTKIGEQKGESK